MATCGRGAGREDPQARAARKAHAMSRRPPLRVGTLAMQLSSVDKAVRALEAERQTLDDSVEMLESTLAAWNKIIARTNALLA